MRIAAVVLGAFLGAGSAPRQERIALFNGKDLSNFYTYLHAKPGGGEPLGKNNDPLGVFTVRDGVIRVSGEVFGYLSTEKEFENYELIVEYRWGEKTYPPRETQARDSGILFHVQGEDKIWPCSLEFQIIEGGTGDLLLVGGASMDFDPALEPRFAGKGMLSPDGKRIVKGRVNWPGRSRQWKDVLGFRDAGDLEKPRGEWNRLELRCRKGTFSYVVNGALVLEGRGAFPGKGRILLQSEGAEIFFRKVDLVRIPGD
ncbi:MAG TPA: DUF1080 domain-containing protein [Planctomycetota bacterium]|nr:DUF1080 domain-containing protein [Planctomycetota bacterium]